MQVELSLGGGHPVADRFVVPAQIIATTAYETDVIKMANIVPFGIALLGSFSRENIDLSELNLTSPIANNLQVS